MKSMNQISFANHGSHWPNVQRTIVFLSLTAVFGAIPAAAQLTQTDIAGSLKQISAASDGAVWGVNAAGLISQWNGTSWTQIAGGLAEVSAGSATNVWGVNNAGQIYKYQGNSTWQQMPGTLAHISAAADGTVVGLDSSGQFYRWNGSAWVLSA